MSTSTPSFPARERRVSFVAVAAIVVSLGLGAVGGSVITRALDPQRPAARDAVGLTEVDAMQGRLVGPPSPLGTPRGTREDRRDARP